MPETPLGPVTRDDSSAAFFDATAEGVLLIRRCNECHRPQAPGRGLCPHCGADDWGWETASGRGTVMAWARQYGKTKDGQEASTSTVGIVELAEGPWMRTRLQGFGPGPVEVGAAAKVAFVTPEGSEAVPVFRPA